MLERLACVDRDTAWYLTLGSRLRLHLLRTPLEPSLSARRWLPASSSVRLVAGASANTGILGFGRRLSSFLCRNQGRARWFWEAPVRFTSRRRAAPVVTGDREGGGGFRRAMFCCGEEKAISFEKEGSFGQKKNRSNRYAVAVVHNTGFCGRAKSSNEKAAGQKHSVL